VKRVKRCIKSGLDEKAYTILRANTTYLSMRDLSVIARYMIGRMIYAPKVIQYIYHESKYTDKFEKRALTEKLIIFSHACQTAHIDVIRVLLRDEQAESIVRSFGILEHAASNGRIEIVRILLKTSMFSPNRLGTSMIEASKKGHLAAVRLLYDERIEKKYINDSMSYSCSRSYVDIVKYFLYETSYRPNNIDTFDHIGAAIRLNKIDVIKLLLEDERTDSIIKPAIAVAKSNRRTEILKLFEGRVRDELGNIVMF